MTVDFFANGLCFYCHLAKNELTEYRDFHSKTESWWKEKDQQLQTQIEDLLKRYPTANRSDIIDSYAWDLHLNESRYPDIHRNSLVVALHTFLEQQLNGLCGILSESLGTAIRVEDLSGRGIERALLFLRKIALFDLGRIPSLSFVRGVNRLRNRIVHASGLLPVDPKDKLNKFIAATLGLRGEPGGYVKIAPEFIGSVIEELTRLFDELGQQVQEFMQKAQETTEPYGRSASAPPPPVS